MTNLIPTEGHQRPSVLFFTDTTDCRAFTNIDNLVTRGFISLYPNPFDDQINIQSEEPITEISLRSIEGVEVGHWMMDKDTQVHIQLSENLAQGIYFGTVYNRFVHTTFKLIHE
jgi:phenolic acid decarboxylase